MVIENELCIDLLKEELDKKGELQLIVHGDSMLPTLKDGNVIKIEKCNEYRIGDIVVFYTIVENQLKIIVHRVIFVRKTYVLTKGDNNDFVDPIKVMNTMILGKVT